MQLKAAVVLIAVVGQIHGVRFPEDPYQGGAPLEQYASAGIMVGELHHPLNPHIIPQLPSGKSPFGDLGPRGYSEGVILVGDPLMPPPPPPAPLKTKPVTNLRGTHRPGKIPQNKPLFTASKGKHEFQNAGQGGKKTSYHLDNSPKPIFVTPFPDTETDLLKGGKYYLKEAPKIETEFPYKFTLPGRKTKQETERELRDSLEREIRQKMEREIKSQMEQRLREKFEREERSKQKQRQEEAKRIEEEQRLEQQRAEEELRHRLEQQSIQAEDQLFREMTQMDSVRYERQQQAPQIQLLPPHHQYFQDQQQSGQQQQQQAQQQLQHPQIHQQQAELQLQHPQLHQQQAQQQLQHPQLHQQQAQQQLQHPQLHQQQAQQELQHPQLHQQQSQLQQQHAQQTMQLPHQQHPQLYSPLQQLSQLQHQQPGLQPQQQQHKQLQQEDAQYQQQILGVVYGQPGSAQPLPGHNDVNPQLLQGLQSLQLQQNPQIQESQYNAQLHYNSPTVQNPLSLHQQVQQRPIQNEESQNLYSQFLELQNLQLQNNVRPQEHSNEHIQQLQAQQLLQSSQGNHDHYGNVQLQMSREQVSQQNLPPNMHLQHNTPVQAIPQQIYPQAQNTQAEQQQAIPQGVGLYAQYEQPQPNELSSYSDFQQQAINPHNNVYSGQNLNAVNPNAIPGQDYYQVTGQDYIYQGQEDFNQQLREYSQYQSEQKTPDYQLEEYGKEDRNQDSAERPTQSPSKSALAALSSLPSSETRPPALEKSWEDTGAWVPITGPRSQSRDKPSKIQARSAGGTATPNPQEELEITPTEQVISATVTVDK